MEIVDTVPVIPPGKKTGCLPRKTLMGSRFPLFGDKIDVIPQSKWKDYAGKISMRRFVPIILDQDGVGCHDEQTEVLTEKGWQRWPDYDRASALGTVNPTTLEMEFQFPTALHSYEYNGPMFVVAHRSSDFMVTPNHRMFVRKWNERKRTLDDGYQIRNADSLEWYSGLLASPSGYRGVEIESVLFDGRSYDGDDFVAMVSLIVSCGYVGGSESTRNRVSFCCFNPSRIESVRRLASRVGFREQANRPGVWDNRNAPELSRWLEANAYCGRELRSHNKRIPAFIKSLSMRQINLFLDSYGDKCDSGSRRSFSTTSRQVADDIQELLLRIGKRSGISSREPRSAVMRDGRIVSGNHDEITVTVWTEDHLSVERKKIDVEGYKGAVFCATVPNSLLVTRRNGKVLISGNSCATEATTQAVMTTRAFAGLPHVLLNPWFIYQQTSGGRDQGSSIDENLEFIMQYGIAPESLHPRSLGWNAKPSAEAMKAALQFRPTEVFDISSIEEMVSAELKGFVVVYGANGHAVLRVEHVDDEHGIDANSWTEDWGDKGFGEWVPYRKVNFQYGAFALRVVPL